MSFTVTSSTRKTRDHFEPEAALDPFEQKQLRGHLEQIDFAAFAANKEVLSQALRGTDIGKFGRLAVAAANARAKWVAAALAVAEKGETMSGAEIANLATLRNGYEELADAYEAMRRMVERGYLRYSPKA